MTCGSAVDGGWLDAKTEVGNRQGEGDSSFTIDSGPPYALLSFFRPITSSHKG